MRANKQNVVIVAVVLMLLLSVLASPYWVVSRIREAIRQQDAQALAEYIDFPALKESFKGQINAMLVEKMADKQGANGLEALGAAMATAFVGPIVDALVTPQAIARMMQGRDVPWPAGVSQPQSDGSEAEQAQAEVSMGYASYDRFNMTVADRRSLEKKISFTLHRTGLWAWKVAAIGFVLPAENAPADVAIAAEPPSDQAPVADGAPVMAPAPEQPPPAEADAAAAPEMAASPEPPSMVELPAAEPVTIGPSFDCTKAASVSEHLICEDAELSALDMRLFELYQHAKAMTTQMPAFKADARAAYQWREANCADKACLVDWYASRKVIYSGVIAEAQLRR